MGAWGYNSDENDSAADEIDEFLRSNPVIIAILDKFGVDHDARGVNVDEQIKSLPLSEEEIAAIGGISKEESSSLMQAMSTVVLVDPAIIDSCLETIDNMLLDTGDWVSPEERTAALREEKTLFVDRKGGYEQEFARVKQNLGPKLPILEIIKKLVKQQFEGDDPYGKLGFVYNLVKKNTFLDYVNAEATTTRFDKIAAGDHQSSGARSPPESTLAVDKPDNHQ